MAKNKFRTADDALDEQKVVTETTDEGDPESQEATKAPESESSEEASEETLESFEVSEPESPTVNTPVSIGLNDRLTRAAREASTESQEAASALNRAEILTGGLKQTLPTLIGAVLDADLKADLQTLLNLL